MNRICYVFFACLISLTTLTAQDTNIKPEVDEIYKMFSKAMWRRMDLEIKQNRPFFSRNGEISKILMDALAAGDLKAYATDSLKNPMADSTVQNMLVFKEQVTEPSNPNDPYSPMVTRDRETPIPGNLFSVMYLKEDVIFDRNRSRMYWYIRTMTITVPGKPEYINQYGITGELSNYLHFNYDEVVEVLRSEKYREKAIWYNGQNISAHRNMADAMELRLFHAPIIKVANNQDEDIRQMYQDEIAADPMKALIIQQQMEYDLAEYEAELWSY